MDAARLTGIRCSGGDGLGEVDNIEHEEEEWVRYWDDLNGAELPQDLVREARCEELDVIRKMGVWERRPREECMARTGRRPVKVRWVDVNKGDLRSPKIRSRLVAKEIKTDSRPE